MLLKLKTACIPGTTVFMVCLMLTAFAGSLRVPVAAAQVVNIESLRVESDAINRLTGSVGLGLNLKKNTTRISEIKTSADLAWLTGRHDFLLLSRNNFMRVRGENVLNDGYVHLRGVFNRNNVWAPELFLQGQYNLDWGLQRRALAGVNMRIRLHEATHFSAFVSSGLMYEQEIWASDADRQVFNYLKSTTSLNVRGRLSEHIEVSAISYYQSRPAHFFKPRFTSDWNVVFELSRYLRLGAHFRATYDSDPQFAATRFIYELNNMLQVRF